MVEESKFKLKKSYIISILEILIISLLVIFFLRMTTVEFYRVSSDSMMNSLQIGDYVVISKLTYFLGISPCLPVLNIKILENLRIKIREIKRGEIVVFFCQT